MLRVRLIVVLLLVAPVFANAQEPKAASAPDQYRQAMSLLLAGDSNQSDRDQAISLLRMAAGQGYAPAQTALATTYEEGVLVTADMTQAIAWYRKAADQGDWIAQFSLGRIYFLGLGVGRDTTAAKQWFTQAAAGGESGPSYFLGLLNDRDQNVSPNYAEAARWYRVSAEHGNPFAQEHLSRLLLDGLGVKLNRQEAYTWLLVAVEFGNQTAQVKLSSMDSDLGKSQAEAVRKQALDTRERIFGVKRQACANWEGQYSETPTAPPLTNQLSCQHVDRS